MCGIAGIVNRVERPAPALEPLRSAICALRHRGPDECGIYRDRHAGLAHTRLSILDLQTGQQPLADAAETRFIVFNGEIFNYLELRAELEGLGYPFQTRSDTEVIVQAWAAWGEAAPARFNGQWAFALWDPRRRELVLCRDGVGILPLYYAERDGRVLFASEVRALFALDPALPRRLDPVGLDETFTFWTVVAPRSVFTGVAELEPGHCRVYAAGGVRDTAFWAPSFRRAHAPRGRETIADAAAEVRHALVEATSLRMLRADVPVGSYLSGGLDSSAIAALALQAKGARFHTFSLRFEDAEYDESSFQQRMVARLGSDHHELLVRRADIAEVFPEVVRHAERPLLRTAPAPLLLLSRLVRQVGIKAVLTGEGADEIFAGYDVFREGMVRRFWARQPGSALRPRLLEKLYPYLARSPVSQRAMARAFFGRELERWREPGFAHGTRWRTTAALKKMVRPEMRLAPDAPGAEERLLSTLPAEFAEWSALAGDQYLEMRTLLSGYLLSSQGDRMLMASSVEGRFPYLDPEVVALASSLPDHYKLRVLDEKHVLKRAVADIVPSEIVDRVKQPYRAPDALAFVVDPPAWVEEVLAESALEAAGVFDVRKARTLWHKCVTRGGAGQFSNTDNMALVALLSTQLLHRDLVAAAPCSDAPRSLDVLIDRLGGA